MSGEEIEEKLAEGARRNALAEEVRRQRPALRVASVARTDED